LELFQNKMALPHLGFLDSVGLDAAHKRTGTLVQRLIDQLP